MLKLAPYFAGGLVACLVMDFVAPPSASAYVNNFFSSSRASTVATSTVATTAGSMERSHKGDRLVTAARAGTKVPVISTVELVGLRNAAIVYRDRDGRILFQSDPLSNATLITKGLTLPEVTIRDHSGATVTPVAAQALQQPAAKAGPVPVETAKQPSARGSRVPVGCDPAFSPLANGASANFAGRCLS